MTETRQSSKGPPPAAPAGAQPQNKRQRIENASSPCTTPERQAKRTKKSPLQLPTPTDADEDEDEDEYDDEDEEEDIPQLTDGEESSPDPQNPEWYIKWPRKQKEPVGIKEKIDEKKAPVVQWGSPLFWLSIKPARELCELHFKARYGIWRYLLKSKDGVFLDRDMRPRGDGHQRIHTAIMGTCRAIYNEACDVLYKENHVFVHSEDIYHLEAHWANMPMFPGLELPKKRIWRHNPLGGVGREVRDQVVKDRVVQIYDSPTLDGYMEPHVFARFRHITLLMPVSEIHFGGMKFIPGTPKIDSMFIDEPPVMKAHFLIFMGKVDIVRTLGRILENSALILQLNVAIQMTGLPFDPINPATSQELEQAAVLATQQLGQHFKNHQSFKPLLDLTNVRTFSPTMCFFHGNSGIKHAPSQATVELLEKWSKQVQEQWIPPRAMEWLEIVKNATQIQTRAFERYTMPFEGGHYGLQMRPLKRMVADSRYGNLGHAVARRSRLEWSEIAEDERLDEHERVEPVEPSLSTPPTSTSSPSLPSAVLPPFPCLDLCPCDRCFGLLSLLPLSSCVAECHCDDCFVPPIPEPCPYDGCFCMATST